MDVFRNQFVASSDFNFNGKWLISQKGFRGYNKLTNKSRISSWDNVDDDDEATHG